jgi:hypothetical protein
MIPLGRGQRELVIGDRKTGKAEADGEQPSGELQRSRRELSQKTRPRDSSSRHVNREQVPGGRNAM